MTSVEYDYQVGLKVSFTREEAFALIDLAKMHYDQECVAAGLVINEQHSTWGSGKENGFLARLTLFSKPLDKEVRVVWPFHNFDVTLKILEQRRYLKGRQLAVCDRLWLDMNNACDLISDRYKLLTANYAEVDQ